jgi:hypothetical protein
MNRAGWGAVERVLEDRFGVQRMKINCNGVEGDRAGRVRPSDLPGR